MLKSLKTEMTDDAKITTTSSGTISNSLPSVGNIHIPIRGASSTATGSFSVNRVFIDPRKIETLSKLAHLRLTESEVDLLSRQLDETVTFINSINQIDTSKFEATYQVTGLENVTREDEIKPSLSQDEALSNSKSTQNGFFKVKGILHAE